jgi:hypothetical protein
VRGADPQRSTNNPFETTVGPGFKGSTCQFPSITKYVLLVTLI